MATFIPETGAGLANSNSYVTLDEALEYHSSRGNPGWPSTYSDDQCKAALVRATAFVDANYRLQFSGVRVKGRDQALEWPRSEAYVLMAGRQYTLPHTAVPAEVKSAVCEVALREVAKPGVMSPDLKEGGTLKALSAGSVSLQFSGITGNKVVQILDVVLSSLIRPSSPYSGKVSRG